MSAIEYICEFSGHCLSYMHWRMYDWKRNSIQVLPEYRPLFKGADAHIEIRSVCFVWLPRRGFNLRFKSEAHARELQQWQTRKGTGSPWISQPARPEDYYGWRSYNGWRLVLEFEYALVVKNENLQGEVKGVYREYSADLGAVRRRLQRLVGHPLKIEWVCEKPRLNKHVTEWARKDWQ